MGKIDLLLATYNGARYLPAQIRSLQNQTYEDWTLYVHDDGSTDATLDVVRRFAAADARICLVDDGRRFGSPADNFLHLLSLSTAPYAVFCDQDDIWLENKLERLYDTISRADDGRPLAAYCNAYVYNPTAGTIDGYATLCHPRTLGDAFFMNGGVQGCSIILNAALRAICLDRPPYVVMHDHLTTLAALAFGRLIYIDERLMLYRRYPGAVTGETYGTFRRRLGVFFQRGKSVLFEHHYAALRSFHEHYRDRLTAEQNHLFERLYRYERRSRPANALAVLHDGFRLYGKRRVLFLKMLLRPLVGKDL